MELIIFIVILVGAFFYQGMQINKLKRKVDIISEDCLDNELEIDRQTNLIYNYLGVKVEERAELLQDWFQTVAIKVESLVKKGKKNK